MKPGMDFAQSELIGLLKQSKVTADLYVKVHGDHLIMGRVEEFEAGKQINDDRVRLTRLSRARYGLSVKRHTGRWERTPFMGTMEEMVETIQTVMQHLVAPY